jgi:hypothetical protein
MMHPRSSELLQGVKPMCVRRPHRREQQQNGDAGEYHSGHGSVFPKALEPIGREFGVANCMLDRAVPEIGLQRSRIVALVGQRIPVRRASILVVPEVRSRQRDCCH